jgi:hypothetical protein
MNIDQHIKSFFRHSFMIVILVVLTGILNNMYAQSNCTNTLKEAELKYENGLIEEIPPMLESCMKRGFTKEEKIRSYKLIIKSYLFNQDLESASNVMLDFLKDYPEYIPERTTDGADFIKLYEKFETLPFISIGAYAGLNFSNISVIQSYSLNDEDDQSYEYGVPGFHVGLQFSRPLHKYIDVSLGVALERFTFEYDSEAFGFSKTSLIERQSRLSIPAIGTFVYQLGNWHPFINLGLSTSFLLNDQATPKRVYTDNSSDDITGTDIDLLPYRNKVDLSLISQIGVRYKVPEGYLFFKMGYQLGLLNQVNVDARYDNSELTYIYYYIDDDFRLNNLSFSFGYAYMFYKPKPKQ